MSDEYKYKSDDVLLMEIKEEIAKFKRCSRPGYKFSSSEGLETYKCMSKYFEGEDSYEKILAGSAEESYYYFLTGDDYRKLELFRTNRALFGELRSAIKAAKDNYIEFSVKEENKAMIFLFGSIGLAVLGIIIAVGIYIDSGNGTLAFNVFKTLGIISIPGFIIGIVLTAKHG